MNTAARDSAQAAIRAEQERVSGIRSHFYSREAVGDSPAPTSWARLGEAQRVIDLAREVNWFHPCLSAAEQIDRMPGEYRERVRGLLSR